MLGKLPESHQRELFRTRLEDLINPGHSLTLLANAIANKMLRELDRKIILNKWLNLPAKQAYRFVVKFGVLVFV